MDAALRIGMCACGRRALWRRGGGGDSGRRVRRVVAMAAVFSAVVIFSWRQFPFSTEELEVFRLNLLNCSEEIDLRAELSVGYTVDDLRVHWAFPQSPNSVETTPVLRREFDQRSWKAVGGKYAHRIIGYLLPPITGVYVFSTILFETTARSSVELWLSPSSDPYLSQLRAFTTLTTKVDHYNSGSSKGVYLQSCGVYYFEFLEQSYNGRSVAEVIWKIPGAWQFSSIPSSALLSVESGSEQFKSPLLPSMSLQRHKREMFVCDSVLPVTELKVLPDCVYESRTAYPHKLRQYWGHKELVWCHIYPNGDSGTQPVPQTFANSILKMYTTAFNKSSHSGVVAGIRYMDRTNNLRNHYLDKTDSHKSVGSLLLLEMDIKLTAGDLVHTSEYVYLASGADTLCHTTNFQWKRNVDVYLVVSVKNLGVWVQHLLHNMEHIYKVTRDEQFELVIVDYGSADLDVESELRASSLPRWKVISMSGGFSRSGGLQAGIDYVTDPDSIVMTIDMHLTLPPGFVEYIRRHTVQGRMGFAPMFFRLDEGHTEVSRAGFWETLTYGLLGMYKSDWIKTGGFDTQKYTTKWGGEDWDAVDKIRSQGLDLFRLGYPGLVHYYHSKAGMWGH